MREIYLSPQCDDVSIKSAESDGVSFDWANRHLNSCERCESYHGMVLARLHNEPYPRVVSETVHEISPGRLTEISAELATISTAMRYLVSLITPAPPQCRLHFDREEDPNVADPIPESALEALEWVVNERLEMVKKAAIERLTAKRNKLLEELRKEVSKA